MIHTKDHQTGYLFDPWDHLGPKRRKIMEQSWAGLFREHILQELPVHKIAPYFTLRDSEDPPKNSIWRLVLLSSSSLLILPIPKPSINWPSMNSGITL